MFIDMKDKASGRTTSICLEDISSIHPNGEGMNEICLRGGKSLRLTDEDVEFLRDLLKGIGVQFQRLERAGRYSAEEGQKLRRSGDEGNS